MNTLELALGLYRHYGQTEEINNYYGLMANYALVQAAAELSDEKLRGQVRELLMLYPDAVRHPWYNFACYRLGGNASAWADMTGFQKRREGELESFAEQTIAGQREKKGLLCMPGKQAEGWIWIDTLFAVVPFMLFAGLSLKKNVYVDFAADQCLRMIEELMDSRCGLVHQCRGFLEDPERCSEDHWSRGNGWGYAALAELIRYLPQEHPMRRKAENLFISFSAAILPYQTEHGLWRQEMTEDSAWEESSGTALLLYGLGIGLRCGLLHEERFIAAFANGIDGLVRYCVHPDFSTEKSCPGCLCPGEGPVKGSIQAYVTEKSPEKDEHHSFGAFMLALVEAWRNGITEIDLL